MGEKHGRSREGGGLVIDDSTRNETCLKRGEDIGVKVVEVSRWVMRMSYNVKRGRRWVGKTGDLRDRGGGMWILR